MDPVRAVVSRDGVPLTAVGAWIDVTSGPDREWQGSFDNTHGFPFLPNGFFHLTTGDGRAGRIMIAAVRGPTVHFRGVGPLANSTV